MNRIIHFAFGILLVFLISLAGAHGPAAAQPFQSQQVQGSAARQFLARAGILDQIAPLEPVVEARGRNYLEPRPADYSPLRSRDQFGYALALAGDALLVGALYADEGANADQGAVYYFTRDTGELNAWSQRQRITASDGAAADYFGVSVALAGDTAIIGALGDDVGANVDQGSAYVFVFDGNSWSQQAKLTAGDGAAGDNFGFSVAVSGDTALIGAAADDVGANSDQGSAYVFQRGADGGWSEQQKLTSESGSQANYFGGSVALDEDTALIGATGDDVAGNTDQGSAYIFARNVGVWDEWQRLVAGDGAVGDQFGGAVALDGYTAIIGAERDDVGANVDQGSAYVFARSDSASAEDGSAEDGGQCGPGECGVWSEQQKLVAGDGAAGDAFGSAAALDGNTVVIGAYLDNVADNANQGSAYLFTRDRGGVTWSAGQRLADSAGAASDSFGAAVAIEGDRIAVGAPGVDLYELPDTGRIYTTVRGPTPWPETGTIVAEDGVQNMGFGYSVALDGDTALIGAPFEDSAIIFVRIGDVWVQQQRLYGGDWFGEAVALDGDTALIGTIYDNVGGNAYQGSASVFVRNGSVWSLQQKLTASDGAEGDHFGRSLAMDGDTAMIGAHGADVGANSFQGAAYVFVRTGSMWNEQQKLTAADGEGDDAFGGSVALDGDTALIGAPGHYVNDGGGSAFVFVRNDSAAYGGLWSEQQTLTSGEPVSSEFGGSVALDGDTAVIGAYRYGLGSDYGQGAAFVFVRTGGGEWSKQQRLTAYDRTGGLGESVALARGTVIAGARFSDVAGNTQQGAAYVFVWNGSAWVLEQKLLAANGAPGIAATHDGFGQAVTLDGDIVLVSALGADVGGIVNQGRAHFFERGASEVFWSYLPAALKP